MDQTMLDVTKIPKVQVGDIVTILGQDGNEQITAMEMAKWLRTISYEVVCGISKRVPRVYLEPT
ncbi:Alanine racemase [Desulfosporosinus sp. I2]|nr:Alanine racemase [Desulfosporosinus sp. I2]